MWSIIHSTLRGTVAKKDCLKQQNDKVFDAMYFFFYFSPLLQEIVTSTSYCLQTRFPSQNDFVVIVECE